MSGASEVRAYLREVDARIGRPVVPGARGQELFSRVPEVLRNLGSVRLEAVGSSCCGTSVAGFSDVDVLVVFTDPIRDLLRRPGWLREVANGEWAGPADASLPYSLRDALSAAEAGSGGSSSGPPAPSRVFADFADRLTAGLPSVRGFASPVADHPAVRFATTSGEPSIELVPGLEADFLWDDPTTAPSSGLSYRVFPGPGDRWLGTHPQLHRETLNCGRGGSDYTCREMIRLLKLMLTYGGGCPLRSYFIELFVLRWVEGSHDLPAGTIPEIIERMNTLGRRPYAHTGPLTRDVVEALAALSAQLHTSTAEGRALDTVDLTTPETRGLTAACASMTDQVVCTGKVDRVLAVVARARHAEETGDAQGAVAVWRRLLQDVR